MPKRFTATEKWDKEWFQMLSPTHKCLWEFLRDRCDCAGVWDTNWRKASFEIGVEVSEKDMAIFGDRVEKMPSGKWWLTGFIEYQYGKLDGFCRAHWPVFLKLQQHTLWHRVRDTLTIRSESVLIKGFVRVSDTLSDTHKEKEKEKEQVQVKVEGPNGTDENAVTSPPPRPPDAEVPDATGAGFKEARRWCSEIIGAYGETPEQAGAVVNATCLSQCQELISLGKPRDKWELLLEWLKDSSNRHKPKSPQSACDPSSWHKWQQMMADELAEIKHDQAKRRR